MIAGLIITGIAVAHSAETKTLSPYFWIENEAGGGEQFPLKSTAVDAVVNGVIADVTVKQVYANEGTHPISARYVFPASTRAAVHGMQMTVGEALVTARIEERRAAQETFKQAKEAGQSATLLEQQRPNVFSMQVANIMPGESVAIVLHYSELLVPESGRYEFVYPTVVGPRYSTTTKAEADDHQEWIQNPYLKSGKPPDSRFDLQVTLAAGLPLEQVACETHAIDLDWQSEATATVRLSQNETHGGNRDFILGYRLSGDQIHSGLMLYEGEKENFFMLMVQPPVQAAPDAIPDREYIFVVDVSGSMHGFPLDTTKVLMRQLIGGLNPADRFNVILFAGAAQLLSPTSLPAERAHIQAAMDLIDRQSGGGGTELRIALKKGLQLPSSAETARTMVVVTDGYIAAEKAVFELIAENLNRCNVFTFGIGSSVNRYLIEGLARVGQGEPFVVTEAEAAPAAANRFKEYVQAPVLTDIQIDFGTFDAYAVEPEAVADLFAQRPLILCGKWKGAPEGIIRVAGTSGNGPYGQQFTLSPLIVSQESRALPFLWARNRLSRLSDFSPGVDDAETRRQITQLGLDYTMLTAYTSFVAVHEVIRNPGASAEEVDQPLPLPLGVSNLAVGGRNVPEPEITLMLILLGAAGLVALAQKRKASFRSR